MNVENTKDRNHGGNLIFAKTSRTLPQTIEGMAQGTKKNMKSTKHLSIQLRRQQNKMKKSNYGVKWLQKSIQYGHAKWESRQSHNVQDMRRRNKVYQEYLEKLESGIDSRRKRLRNLSERCTITMTIYNSDNATQSRSKKIHNKNFINHKKHQTLHIHGRH